MLLCNRKTRKVFLIGVAILYMQPLGYHSDTIDIHRQDFLLYIAKVVPDLKSVISWLTNLFSDKQIYRLTN